MKAREDTMTDAESTLPSPGASRRSRRDLRALAGAAALAACVLAGDIARATPATLANDADVAAFAERVRDYAGASRVRWVVAARSHADAASVVANVSLHLKMLEVPDETVQRLEARITAQSFRDSPEIAPGASIPVAWMAPQAPAAEDSAKCSWQVWVRDPGVPSIAAEGVSVPLLPNDKLPVGPEATFRVSYSGLLQSRLYAFDQTRPGAIRDLAAAPDINIPVAAGADSETILLAMAREPAPYYEEIRTALATSAGQRRDLGKDHTLIVWRGIGANIQSVTPLMVTARNDKSDAPRPDPGAQVTASGRDTLIERCFYSLVPARGAIASPKAAQLGARAD